MHINGQELGSTLAIGCNALGQLTTHIAQYLTELVILRGISLNLSHTGLTVSQYQYSIIGAHISIYGNHIESNLYDFGQSLLHQLAGNIGISGNIAKHGSHIWLNHTRAFSNSTKANSLATNLYLSRASLGISISSNNSIASILAAILRKLCCSGLDTSSQLVHRQVDTNNTSRAYQYIISLTAQLLSSQGSHLVGISQSNLSSAGIGTASVCYNSMGTAGLYHLTGNNNRSCCYRILGKYTSYGSLLLCINHC